MINPTAKAGDIPEVVDTITVRQDVGSYEPVYKLVTLTLMSNGMVFWSNLHQENGY